VKTAINISLISGAVTNEFHLLQFGNVLRTLNICNMCSDSPSAGNTSSRVSSMSASSRDLLVEGYRQPYQQEVEDFIDFILSKKQSVVLLFQARFFNELKDLAFFSSDVRIQMPVSIQKAKQPKGYFSASPVFDTIRRYVSICSIF